MQAGRVRVVATSTLRRAKSTGRFLQRAAKALGHPVEIISGIEEARLVYLGASHTLPRVDGPQIVVDIGGGSTEIIAGKGWSRSRWKARMLGVSLEVLGGRCQPELRRPACRSASAPSAPSSARWSLPRWRGRQAVSGGAAVLRHWIGR
jgi:exopolyphosphatase/guanosine-5'-triphosphate,3'-diphosphate pyrophosphatase